MIEFFREPSIDWMGKAKYFYALSAVLLLAGWSSIFIKHGLRYGIDFKGGTNVDVRFAQPPDIDQLRKALTGQGLGNSEIQAVNDTGIASSKSNEVLIFVEQKGQTEAEDANKTQVINALNSIYGGKDSSKPDINAVNAPSLAATLNSRDPLGLSTNAGDRYPQLARRILGYRGSVKGGVLTNFNDISAVDGVTPAVISVLKDSYTLGQFSIQHEIGRAHV